MGALWPNGKNYPGDVWHEYGPRAPIWTPNGYTSNFHGGIDIGPWSGSSSTWLLAPVAGEVVYATYDPIFGNRVIVSSGGVDFWLCHGRDGSTQVSRGDRVTQGQRLMLMGETGKASGVHVHYEVHVNGVRVDPRAFYANPTGGNGIEDEMSARAEQMIEELYQQLLPGKAGVKTQGQLNKTLVDTASAANAAKAAAESLVADFRTGQAGVRNAGRLLLLLNQAQAEARAASAAIAALATANGADPAAILKVVQNGVRDAMKGISFTVENVED